MLPPPPSRWNSAIVPEFPKLFQDFKDKRFTLLWRGSRDGFGVRDFHSRCDGHTNTLMVILDTNGMIFGGFTPVEWESRVWNGKKGIESNCWKPDPSRKSFLFTLKNPHSVPPRIFVLKAEKNGKAISCQADWGPHFCDIHVANDCNTNTKSWTYRFGQFYTNDTGLVGGPKKNTFFTGSEHFRVQEIEVFEVAE
jgi:hypothetical protein